MTTTAERQLTADPVIEWLERCRDYSGATRESRELAQRAIDRLAQAEVPTPAEVLAQVRASLGTWRDGPQGVVSDRPLDGPGQDDDNIRFYGGYLVGESMGPRTRVLVAHLPQLLAAADASPEGQAVLDSLARALAKPQRRPFSPVADHLDGALRCSALADEFGHGDLDGAAEILRHLAAALIGRRVPEYSGEVRELLRRRR